MSSNEMKNKSFRLSEEVTEKIGEMLKGRQITTNQLFEEFIVLAEQKEIDPKLSEEDAVLEASLKQITLLFQERAARLETLQHENQRIQSRHLDTVTKLESEVLQTKEDLEAEYIEKVSIHQQELDEMKIKLEQTENELFQLREQHEKREVSKKEEITLLKRDVFHLEGNLTKLKEERDQLYRQNKALTDRIDELKVRTERSERLEKENQKLLLDLTIAQRDQESFERHLHEQVELAVLRERTSTK
ncbi:hypothetical protein [Exiguobacterium acetylicum]|uniref:hypothetical protein n=1 Tax=Exiguobacterium acetylicum TaxID=41170 RepID=UPI001CA5FC78|nr:hypothetical protein [Exiguobacterium acetylicum]QZY88538.1 hypothetical protein K7G97_17120 [Exiguobacterium acetylicum]